MCDCKNCRKKKFDIAFKNLKEHLLLEKENKAVPSITVSKQDLQVLLNYAKELEDAR